MNGMLVRHGAVDVGQRTTQAVVTSSLGVLISNFFLSILLNYFFPI
jgi:phospholipid/cholesterol/gamma-HCH transport system permease protein